MFGTVRIRRPLWLIGGGSTAVEEACQHGRRAVQFELVAAAFV